MKIHTFNWLDQEKVSTMHFLKLCIFCTVGNKVYILMLLQVVHMQCNVELIEEGAKFHVSFM